MYYVIEIAQGTTRNAGETINKFETLREAQAYFYKQYANALNSKTYTSELIVVMDNSGTFYNVEHFEGE